MKNISIKIAKEKLNLQNCLDFVQDDSCGGISFFVGTVRNHTDNKTVLKLEFSTYKSMAIKEMQKIALQTIEKFEITKLAIHHFEGELKIGEIPVIIAASSPHRKNCIAACQFAIDELKKTVPIWKKEFFEDGSVWVNSRP